ncbi:hypothetical protein Sme01_03200 [Sphaerisporangium melleum]|uniref:Uncharacterized protein n=1 Tax=Sphaerisporangium melleum TaxID=321316 RepID=A0A917QPD7_9ACTN|nr:hypothetical protein GCM10007964_00740 [Sphaerisporangium melleum]GII67844.1 hypothetical protein Sme01_03200 [Sphaerisporangium melleum]
MSNSRKRAIRALMAETGLKYTAAMRELDRREAEREQGTAEPTASDHRTPVE